MSNRLAGATSPYLLQHADNPVDWWEWSDEAFAEAARRDVPVLLSVGYAACHWCHVMAHESFEDEATAEQVNAGFVAVKVDREERPDIDAVYMAATQAMTGQGGWPMTCFLTPAGEPFHCGTYYPTAHFRRLLDAREPGVGRRRRAGAQRGGPDRGPAGRRRRRPRCRRRAWTPSALDRAAQALAGDFDAMHGGFGGAPKFPPSMSLEFLLRHHERTGSAHALRMVEPDRGADGTRRDVRPARRRVRPLQRRRALGGAALREDALRQRAAAARLRAPRARPGAAARLARRVAEETAAFLLRDLRTPEGGFASALDADTDGVEGLTYAWTPAQLTEVLGDDDGGWAAELLVVTPAGTFEHGSSTLQLPARPAATRPAGSACGPRCSPPATGARSPRATTRSSRRGTAWRCSPSPRPGRRWVTTPGSRRRGRPRTCWSTAHMVDGRAAPLVARRGRRGRRRRPGRPRLPRRGAARAAPGHGEARRLEQAGEVLDLALAHFADPAAAGTFFDTADDAEALLHRPREVTDNATPSGAAALAGALLTASVLVDDPQRYRAPAEAALRSAGTLARALPAVRRALADGRGGRGAGPAAGRGGRPGAGARGAGRARTGDRARRDVVVAGDPDAPGVPLLAAPPAGRRRGRGLRLPRLRLRPPRHRPRRAHRRPPPAPRSPPAVGPYAGRRASRHAAGARTVTSVSTSAFGPVPGRVVRTPPRRLAGSPEANSAGAVHAVAV